MTVPGTCATPEEYWYWLLNQHGITRPVVTVRPDYCGDGDSEGCSAMRRAGQCPYSAAEYAAIQRHRHASNSGRAGRPRVAAWPRHAPASSAS